MPVESIITSHEIDALDYLGGYVIHNIEKRLIRKKNDEGVVIPQCFKSDNLEVQQLIDLLSGGGLIGINAETKQMFLNAEKLFRTLTQKENPQKII